MTAQFLDEFLLRDNRAIPIILYLFHDAVSKDFVGILYAATLTGSTHRLEV